MRKTGTYNEDGEKWCCNCKTYHQTWMFGVNRASKDGLSYMCEQSRRKTIDSNHAEKMIMSERVKRDDMVVRINIQRDLLRMQRPHTKLAKPYEYTRPDAWDNHLEAIKNNSLVVSEVLK